MVAACCSQGCLGGLWRGGGRRADAEEDDAPKPFGRRSTLTVALVGPADAARPCARCGAVDDGLPRGDEFLCRECIRRDDERRLEPTELEQLWLDRIAAQLNQSPWSHWKPGVQPAEILDWLYLGDLKEALDLEGLRSRGITAVLNCINWWELTAKLPPELPPEYLPDHYERAGVRFKQVDLEDRLFSDLASEWPAAEAFLRGCRQDGQKVLVNCVAGHNRSAALVVCWLLLREAFDFVQAFSHTQQRRGCILSNHGYRLAIVRLAAAAGLLPPEAAPAGLRGPPPPDDGPRRAQSAVVPPRAGAARPAAAGAGPAVGLYQRLQELRGDERYASRPQPGRGRSRSC